MSHSSHNAHAAWYYFKVLRPPGGGLAFRGLGPAFHLEEVHW